MEMSDSRPSACTVGLPCASHTDARPRTATAAPPVDASARVQAGARSVGGLGAVGGDGLPLLPCHARQSAAAVFAVTGAAAALAQPPLRAQETLDELGECATRASVRSRLLDFYERTDQLSDSGVATGVSEMTLRVDTELELLRRQCFAERNAQWGNRTPDMFAFAPAPTPVWTPQPMNAKHALRLLHEDGGGLFGAEKKDTSSTLTDAAAASVAAAKKKREKYDFPVGAFARERPWPPEEFALKPHSKPSRVRSKRKHAAALAAAAAEEKKPVLAKSCVECLTQSTPLWRSQTRQRLTMKLVVVQPEEKPSVLEPLSQGLNPAFATGERATLVPPEVKTEEREVTEDYKVDLCLACFLKLERSHLFEKKHADQKRMERERREQAAKAALQEKKRLKQQIHQLKKQQKQLKQKKHEAAEFVDQPVTAVAEEREPTAAPVLLTFTREEIAAATSSAEEARKKERKRARKDKKKKKKRRRRYEDSESDGPTPLPSPPQMEGFEYADRAPEPYAAPSQSPFDVHEPDVSTVEREEPVFSDGYDVSVAEEFESGKLTGTRTSSRTRKTVKRTVSPARSPGSPRSKKRKSTSNAGKASHSRSSRPKRAASVAAPEPVTVAVAATPASSTRKRGRSKKELARERELRALGQYCPVCSEVYEEDDESTFVCCDSCELWVHGACDPTLSPEIIAALADSSEKYICPLCAGR